MFYVYVCQEQQICIKRAHKGCKTAHKGLVIKNLLILIVIALLFNKTGLSQWTRDFYFLGLSCKKETFCLKKVFFA